MLWTVVPKQHPSAVETMRAGAGAGFARRVGGAGGGGGRCNEHIPACGGHMVGAEGRQGLRQRDRLFAADGKDPTRRETRHSTTAVTPNPAWGGGGKGEGRGGTGADLKTIRLRGGGSRRWSRRDNRCETHGMWGDGKRRPA